MTMECRTAFSTTPALKRKSKEWVHLNRKSNFQDFKNIVNNLKSLQTDWEKKISVTYMTKAWLTNT